MIHRCRLPERRIHGLLRGKVPISREASALKGIGAGYLLMTFALTRSRMDFGKRIDVNMDIYRALCQDGSAC